MSNIVSIEYADNYRLETLRSVLKRSFANLGLPKQNPLGGIISPGNTVFIKPNWVASRWRASCSHRDSLYSVVTHPHMIEAVVEFVAEALHSKGQIIIGDNPSIDADFNELMEKSDIKTLQKRYAGLVSVLDLRPLICTDLRYYGKQKLMASQQGDPKGSIEINLGNDSLLYGIDPSNFRGVFDEREETIASHSNENQLYTYSRSLYDADVYISIPKLKTHQKVGATLNLKGLVGTVSNKNQLVHWRVGYPETGGDEYPNREAWEAGQKAKVTHRGAWPGNDTIWRMVVDLYKGFSRKVRKYLSVIDGIIAGEGQGPFCPTSKFANTVIVGDDLLVTDCAAVRYMGFDPSRIRYLDYFISKNDTKLKIDDIVVVKHGTIEKDFFAKKTNYLDFDVPDLWRSCKFM